MKAALLAALLAGFPAAAQQPYPQLKPGQFLPTTPPPSAPAKPETPPTITAPTPPAPVTQSPLASPEWLPMGTGELRVLDKLSARVTPATLKKGDTVAIGTLSITLRACAVRPGDRAPDAAAFLDITDSTGAPGFHGWMLVSAPAMTVLENPSYDVRPIACRP